jgi:hypothetical protein
MDDYQGLNPEKKSIISKKECYMNNMKNNGTFELNSFGDNLNISDIKDEIKKAEEDKVHERKKEDSIKIYNHQNLDKDFSVDLDNINEDEFTNERKISLCSLQSEEFNYNNFSKNLNSKGHGKKVSLFNKKESKKVTKEDLNYIPLPLFSCIYCCNDKISFKHLSQEIISNNYLFQSSIYDIMELNKLIIYQPILDKDNKNEKLLNIIIKNTEYIKEYYFKDKSIKYFKSNNYLDLCHKALFNNNRNCILKIEDSVVKNNKDFYFRGIKIIPKNSLNNKGLFNSTNSLINNCNALGGFVESIPINNNNMNIGKTINNNISNLSINFNSISSNNNETGNILIKDNNNLLVSSVGKIEKNVESINEIDNDKEEIMDFFKFDLERKIKKEDINWENDYYDIWNPNIEDNDLENEQHKKKSKIHLLKSNNISNSKKSNNSFITNINKTLSISQMKSFGSTNNSTEINFDNGNKIKTNLYHQANYSSLNNKNCHLSKMFKKIKINDILKEKINNCKIIKTPISLKVNKIKLNNHINKINSNYFNEPNIINMNKTKYIKDKKIVINENPSKCLTLNNITNKKIITNVKYAKTSTKTFPINKVLIKKSINKKSNKIKKIKIKYFPHKLNCYISNSNKSNNSTIDRIKTTPTSSCRNEGGTKIVSLKKNKYSQNNNEDNQNIIKSSRKKINVTTFSNNYLNLKNSIHEINDKNLEISRISKKQYHSRINYQKLKDNIANAMIITNKNLKVNNSQISGYIINKNFDNNKLNINKKPNKINKNLLFTSSLFNNLTTRTISNNKKFL